MNQAKAEFFDSQVHEPWASSAFGPDETAKIGRMLEHARIGAGMRVLEPGCGTGRLTATLADLVGPEGHVLALDISSGMIESAHRRLGTRDNVTLERSAIETYAFDPESFDVVVCHNTFPHFDDKPVAVGVLVAALKNGGRFIVFHFMNSAWINDLHRKADASVLNDLIPPEDEMCAMLEAAGLRVVLLEDDEYGYLLCSTRG